MQSLGRPFVYFSEAVLTPNRAVAVIETEAKKLGATPRFNVQKLWTETALSVRSQASLQRMPGYKGDKFHNWLGNCVETLTNNFEFSHQEHLHQFRRELMSQLFKPSTYSVPGDIKALLRDLQSHKVGWGVIANDSHMYLAILKMLKLEPLGPILQAQGPQMFKPLPQMWQRAVQKAPVASQHNLWFVGSQQNPCDNMNANPRIRCALIAPHLESPDPLSQHFRVPHVNDLRQYLLPLSRTPELSELNLEHSDEEVVEEEPDLKFTTFRPKVPEKKEPEASIFRLKSKS